MKEEAVVKLITIGASVGMDSGAFLEVGGRKPGEAYCGMVTGHRRAAVLLGLDDPDGIEIRLYAE
jgi:hypothetical protein